MLKPINNFGNMFLNDILGKLGLQIAHIYYMMEQSADYSFIRMQVAIQQCGQIPRMLLKKNAIVAQRRNSLPYEDWVIQLHKENTRIVCIQIGGLCEGEFQEDYRIDVTYNSYWEIKKLSVESCDDLERINFQA